MDPSPDLSAEPAAQDDQLEREDIARLMSSEFGRRIVLRLIRRAGVFRLSYDPAQGGDVLAVAFREGRRSEGNRLFAMVQAVCPGQWQTALAEWQKVTA